MKINKIMIGAGALAAAGAVTAGLYLMKRKASDTDRTERLAPKDIQPKANEVLSPQLTPEYLRYGGGE
jgi:hypothetical protein